MATSSSLLAAPPLEPLAALATNLALRSLSSLSFVMTTDEA
eukprot:CAMPEP_0170950448 /NCGR_PEP_ID=MMETSP0735-20130129/29983_1 /TAXON_ID=186038 /ORGANISM="Fragilariopsis kerguelensis, Strain L26-C5" /LENGTH=40 /DNA_ID= /DNA_START= /DNA_END= /DNA_ORIENTATION=